MRIKEIDRQIDKMDKEIHSIMSDLPNLSEEEVINRINIAVYSYHELLAKFKEQ